MHAAKAAVFAAVLVTLPVLSYGQQGTAPLPANDSPGVVRLREALKIRGIPKSAAERRALQALPADKPEPMDFRRACEKADIDAAAGVVDIRIDNFVLGSATLPDESRWRVDELGQAISGLSTCNYRFRIEGFTDTTGDATLNQGLSLHRANEVKQRLVQLFRVNPARLVIEGHGKDPRYLKVQTPDNTDEPQNRRIRITNMDTPNG